MIGIYKITNIINNKCYIGSSVDIVGRWYHHKTTLKFNKHHSIKLQRSYNKYGSDNFKYEIVEECETELLLIREEYYINLFDCYNNGYNFSIPSNCVMLGRHHSEETKEILREKSKGNKNRLNMTFSDESKKKISDKLKGRKLSDETKLNMSKGQKNRIYSDEDLKKITEINKSRIGIPLSDEHKLKLSLAKVGKKQSPETIAKRVQKNTGQKRKKT